MLDFYAYMSGALFEDEEGERQALEFKAFLGKGVDGELPLFLNSKFVSFGNISILKARHKMKRSINRWGEEDLGVLEIGHREFHEKNLPVVTLEKIICTLEPNETLPSCLMGVQVLKNKTQVLLEGSIHFVYRKTIEGITYLERVFGTEEEASIDFASLFEIEQVNIENDYITLKFTLILPSKFEEDFEFELIALSKSFFIKAVNYVDFKDRKYVLVLKNMKLHGNCSFSEFTEVFDKQNVFVDDFTSSRVQMPPFSPPLFAILNKHLLAGKIADSLHDDFITVEDTEDEYVNKFYRLKFASMRYDLIENNFIKAKLQVKVWWDFAQSLTLSAAIERLFDFNLSFIELNKVKEIFSSVICPESRGSFGDLLSVCILGIKSEVRTIFWEKVSGKEGKHRVSEVLGVFSPKMVEQIYKMVNAKNIYEVRCVFRNHQRIVTHYLKILEDMQLGNKNVLPFLAKEVELVVLMIHEFFHKGHFTRASNGILLLCSLICETPQGRETKMDYFLRVNQRELMLLKIILANADPELLTHLLDLGLSIEGLFAHHMISNFSSLFMVELCLRIRDIYFLIKFYPSFRRYPNFDFYILFKCCLITSILKEYRDLFLVISDPTNFITAFEVTCKTYSNFENLLVNAISLCTFFFSDSLPQASGNAFKEHQLSSFRDLIASFDKINDLVQIWDTSVPRMKYHLEAFSPMLQQMKSHYTSELRKMHFDDFINMDQDILSPRNQNDELLDPSTIFLGQNLPMDAVENNVRSCEYDSHGFSNVFTFEDTVAPTVFSRSVKEDRVVIYLHQLIHRQFRGIKYLYLICNDMTIFATKLNEGGIPEKQYIEIILPTRTTHIDFKLRDEYSNESDKTDLMDTGVGMASVDNYEGRLELKNCRIDIIEKSTIPLRSYDLEGGYTSGNTMSEIMAQCDLQISVLLSYVKKTKLDDFTEILSHAQKVLYIENYWRVQKRWLLANFVEQNSLVPVNVYQEIKEEFFKSHTQLDNCFAVFDKFVELDYDMIPLCKGLLLSVFYSNASISDKLNMLWDTMTFFEKLQEEFYIADDRIESNSVQYFLKIVCSGVWASLPEYAAENLIDHLFYGSIPSIRRAFFISPIVNLILPRKHSTLQQL